MAAKEFIVAIELGSSKVTGIAGKKNLDGSISVLAVVKEDSSSFIRKGVVYNINQTVQCISSIVKKLSSALKAEISRVYVGVGGQSIVSVKNVIVKDLPEGTVVSQDLVNELMDMNRAMSYQDKIILDAAVQEYKVDSLLQLNPVGIQCSRLEGNYLNVLWRKSFYNNVYNCFDMARVTIADMFPAPQVLADSVLTDAEKRSGCVLVDLGADTTTVSVYYKNILRHLVVIPLGGNNITKDIASLQMEESEAEAMKLKYASAYTDAENIDSTKTYPIDSERNVECRKFIEIVEGRMQEIIENVRHQIPLEFADRLLGGIILTGGGSNMKDIDKAFRNYMKIEKIRIAKFVRQTVTSSSADTLAHNGTMNTVLAILAKGEMNCAGEETPEPGDLFGQDQTVRQDSVAAEAFQPNRPMTPAGQSGVRQPADAGGSGGGRLDKANDIAINEGGTQQPAENNTGKGKKNAKRSISKLKIWFDKFLKEPEE